VKHAVERLTTKPGEKKKKFKNTLLENFNSFFETFHCKNLMDDAELDAVVKQAKKILAGMDADTLRNNDTMRETVAAEFKKIESTVDRLVVEKPSRRFSFDE